MTDEKFMAMALEEASAALDAGEVPIGAVLVLEDGFIISRAHNLIEQSNDATQHAELIAIREASRILGRRRLSDCTLYSTLEPCPMCAGALVMSRVKRLVYGAPDSRAGAVDSVFNVVDNPWLNHQLEIRAGVMEEQCRALLQKFFSARRAQR
ncbi:MAG: tRNA adenosine(34) deaminase TadA [Selenomonadaceae bacterium]|nr:tRNA adenosine(34) deaminase TadA [Selenomonadaceae bacterium]